MMCISLFFTQFNLVATRRAAKLVVKALKEGDKTVTLVPEEEGGEESAAA